MAHVQDSREQASISVKMTGNRQETQAFHGVTSRFHRVFGENRRPDGKQDGMATQKDRRTCRRSLKIARSEVLASRDAAALIALGLIADEAFQQLDFLRKLPVIIG
ncbi:hypothetical protein [Nitratireductor sp. L15S-10]|uniref:hypothetical protein n=1 Tax=Nitratireductor sp. L15S-10 TaxID=3034028 RepID=UPI0038579CF8